MLVALLLWGFEYKPFVVLPAYRPVITLCLLAVPVAETPGELEGAFDVQLQY